MQQPSNLLLKLSQQLFRDATEQGQFVQLLCQAQKSFNPSIVWRDPQPHPAPFEVEVPLPWQPAFVERLTAGQKPGQHPLHTAGAFYCLDFSSVFAISPLLTLPQPVDLVVDVCASPGGKSIFAWVALQPHRLLSNEVIGKRTAQLIANLRRCRVEGAIALRLDSQVLAAEIPQTAQVVLVDAPCTGQSLLAKGGKAPGCFHPVTIKNNANRQKRILANSAQVVAPAGHLLYMTCTYSPAENEQVATWFLDRFPHFRAVTVSHLMDYQSHLTDIPCYRLFPQSGLGAGAFTILFQNTATGDRPLLSPAFLSRPGLTVI